MIQKNSQVGILLMVLATSIFAIQDGISRYLASEYNVMMVVMVRYWFFAFFVILLVFKTQGGIKKAFSTPQPFLQFFRGTLLALEVCVIVLAFTFLGLVESHAIFACYPLLAAALSVPILGEKVGWRRWVAIGIGCIGVLIILQPGIKIFSPYALLAITSALMFALYGLLTRYAAIKDDATTSFFWTGVSGAIIMTCLGFWYWEPLAIGDYSWMILLCITAVLGHYLLIKCYESAEVSVVQPFAYFQLLFITIIGISIFNEKLEPHIFIGASIIIGAGLFTLYREKKSIS